MGDKPKHPQTPKHLSSYDHAQEALTVQNSHASRPGGRGKGVDTVLDANSPFFSQYPNSHPAERSTSGQAFAYHNPMGYAPQAVVGQPSALNMGHMAGVLPTYQGHYAASMALQQPSPAPIAYGQQSPNQTYLMQQMPYPAQYPQGQYPTGYYPLGPAQQYHQPYPSQMYSSAPIYPSPPGQMYQMTPYRDPRVPVPIMSQQGGDKASHPGLSRLVSQPGRMTGQMAYLPNRAQDFNFPERSLSSGEQATDGSRRDHLAASNISRGPPRKPRQSGHALWVGNLPPDATVTDLKDHFSREATKDIESLKLISKSSCAFVNYRTQAACASAMTRFHDSRFHGTRLVCRLRRTSAPSPATPAQGAVTAADEEHQVDEESETATEEGGLSARTIVPEKFFVLKSLTLQDLEISTRNGMWATQAHNEKVLNEAFKSAENVYLIFSANKSGEYFGYARMCSEITGVSSDSDLALHRQTTSSTESVAATTRTPASFSASGRCSGHSDPAIDSGPKAIPTTATEWAPRGKIIDDLARGTIFWEADLEEESPLDANATLLADPIVSSPIVNDQLVIASSTSTASRQRSQSESFAVEEEPDHLPGNSFRLEWISTRKVPFFKTRGIRNPWNANREVKIARDGTEIETTVGKKLLALFGSSNARPSHSFI